MRLRRWRHLSAMLLIVGGLLEAVALTVSSFISPPGTTFLGATILLGDTAGLVCIGCGLVTNGVSLAGRGRTALKIAGALAVVAAFVNAVQTATAAPLGPGPSQAAYVLYVITVVVAAARLLSNANLRGPARWAIAVPAGCFILNIVTLYVPVPSPGVFLLPWAGTAVAGVLLARSLRQSSTNEPHPA